MLQMVRHFPVLATDIQRLVDTFAIYAKSRRYELTTRKKKTFGIFPFKSG